MTITRPWADSSANSEVRCMTFGLFNINYNSDTFQFILAKVEQNGAFELDVTSRIRVTKKKHG